MTELPATADFVLDGSYKGMPASLGETAVSALGGRCLNLLDQQVEFPIAILKSSALRHNQAWIAAFLARTGALIAPHGKTTMSPDLIAMQVRDGAWAVTAATSAHVRSYHANGVRRIVHANQLVGSENMRGIFALLADDPGLDFYTLVDSPAGLDLLRDGLGRWPIGRPLQVLLELGAPGGRTGVRIDDDARGLARTVAVDPLFALAGVECFEGIYSGRTDADDGLARMLLERLVRLATSLHAEGLFAIAEPLFTAGGSAYLDLVAQVAASDIRAAGFRVVVRSGCYLTHDSAHYRIIHERLGLNENAGENGGGLRAALEVWGCVQSRPEPGLVIVNLGKRDVSYDIDLPVPLWTCARGGRAVAPVDDGSVTRALNDQHLFLTVPPNSSLTVGDLVGFGVSHPCTTFDKWKALFVVDDAYSIETAIRTCF